MITIWKRDSAGFSNLIDVLWHLSSFDFKREYPSPESLDELREDLQLFFSDKAKGELEVRVFKSCIVDWLVEVHRYTL